MPDENKILIALAEIKIDLKNLLEQHEEIKEELYGNGRPGIKEDVLNLKNQNKNLEKTLTNILETKRISWGYLVLIVTALISPVVLVILQKYIK